MQLELVEQEAPKKRKVEEVKRPEIKKPRGFNDPPSRPGSAQSNYSVAPAPSVSRAPTFNASSTSYLKSSASSSTAALSSSMGGSKYVVDHARSMTAPSGGPARVSTMNASTSKSQYGQHHPVASSSTSHRVPQQQQPLRPVIVEQEEYVELPDIDS